MSITERIEQLIAERKLGPGSRIPTERDLADLLDAPRSAVRNALSLLEKNGKIWRHVGRGTFLGAKPDMAPTQILTNQLLDETNPAEVLEARLILEPGLAAQAALRATQRHVIELRDIVLRGDNASSFEEYEHWDAAFHETVVAAAQNHLCEQIYKVISNARTQSVWGRLKKASLTMERRMAYQTSHRSIAEAIADRDAEATRRLMLEHVAEVRQNMLG